MCLLKKRGEKTNKAKGTDCENVSLFAIKEIQDSYDSPTRDLTTIA